MARLKVFPDLELIVTKAGKSDKFLELLMAELFDAVFVQGFKKNKWLLDQLKQKKKKSRVK